jgi:hypothetical protein
MNHETTRKSRSSLRRLINTVLENDPEKVQSGLSLEMQAQTEWPGQVVDFKISGSTYHHL